MNGLYFQLLSHSGFWTVLRQKRRKSP